MQWLQVLSEGWAFPLKGFTREDEYIQCTGFSCITTEKVTNQSISIALPVSREDKERLKGEVSFTLKYKGKSMAILRDPEFYEHRKEDRCTRQLGTTNPKHPYIKIIKESGDWLVGGAIDALERVRWDDGFDKYRLTAREFRIKFKKDGCRCGVCLSAQESHPQWPCSPCDSTTTFQLHIHSIEHTSSHYFQDCKKQLLRQGYEKPYLLLHPLGGWTKDDDIRLKIRIAQHQAVLEENILDPVSTVLAIFPSPMMYDRPTEVS